MHWKEMRWRVVTLNADDKIIKDVPAPHFAAAKPIYDNTEPKRDELVRLQHGARIVFSKPSDDSGSPDGAAG